MRAQDVGDFERRSLLGAGVRVSRSVMGSWRGKEWRCHCVCSFLFLLIFYFSAGAALSGVWSLPTRSLFNLPPRIRRPKKQSEERGALFAVG
jgi:hypothetical protein